MAEYSRLASGSILSNGGATNVVLPFTPSYVEVFNSTEAAAATGGVSHVWWTQQMGQGAAFYVTTGVGPADGSNFVTAATGGGISTFQGALSLQYGAVQNVSGITKASAAVVTSSAPHGLVSGNVVIFQNLYQTSTTGMQQITGIPFVITKTGASTFTIPWNTNQSNYAAITGAATVQGTFKQVLYPSLYFPGQSFITAIGTGATTTITTTAPHNLVVGQEVGFRIPPVYGTTQLNELPNSVIPGSPMYGYVTIVNSSTQVTVNINSVGYTALNTNQPFTSFPGLQFPQMVAVGDINSGGWPYTGGALYPSALVYNGYSTSQVRTLNGPSIQGAYINATMQGFIIGATVAGTAADQLYWRAQYDDLIL